jgi:hypothetical protein
MQPYPVYIPGAMPETLEVPESVNTADIAILFNSYLEF